MDLSTAFAYGLGLLALLLLLQLLAAPIQVLLKCLGSSLIGGAVLWAVNLVGAPVGWHIGLNPVSAGVVGLLGAPGLAALFIMRWLFP